ncbi:MAG: hypothetical protein SFV53_01425, partial [Rickettsiales bacterium]|nr:hypothetical protein [Rickettsiales bacterium]
MPFEEKSFSGCQIIDDNSNNTVKAISGLSTERGISVCEAANLKRGGQGRNSNQQDAFFVGTVEADVASNPEKSFAESLKPIIEKYDNFECGTTLCSAIATPDGKGGVNITTANLGDSRAAVVVKYLHKDSNGDEKIGYRSILLTEDMSPKTKRFANQVIEKGGIIYGDRVNGDSATAGSIGDSDIKGLNKESALIRNPEVWQINSERFFSSSQETLLELDLIVSCDGLWEYNLTCDFSYYKEKSTDTDIKFRELNASSEKRLSNLKKTYDKQTESEKQKQSFADYLVAHALKSGSRDNITAISVPLISETEGVLIENGSGGIIATVCDGHGKGANKEIQEGREDGFYFRGIKYNSREEAETEADKKATEEASSEANTQAETFRKKDLSIEIEEVKDGISSKDDGCLVASSVAADVFTALKVKEIKGLEISDKHQEPLAQIIKKRNPSRSSNDSSKTANNNQKTREEILRDVTSDHLPQRFTIETQKGSKINIATWNVLQQCQSKAKSGTGYSNNPWDFDE